jgi:hypothetical protein
MEVCYLEGKCTPAMGPEQLCMGKYAWQPLICDAAAICSGMIFSTGNLYA